MINCDHCGMIFKFPSQLERHLSRKFPCFTKLPPENGKNPIEENTRNDKISHADDNKTHDEIVCHKCNKALSTKSSLKRHLNVCNGCHSLQCPNCLKMFSSASSKSQHISKVDCKPPNGLLCKEKPHRQSVYLLIEREFLALEKNVFKIGRSENVSNRAKQYPNGSQLLVVLPCIDCKESETHLKRVFQKNFKHRPDIGSEYFEGTPNLMIQTFIKNVEAHF